MPQEISGGNQRAIHVAAEETLQVRESDGTLRVCSHVVRALINENLAAKLDGMFPVQDRNHVGKLVDAVGTHGFGPAQTQREIKTALKCERRQPEVGWIRLPRVDVVRVAVVGVVRRILRVIVTLKDLVIVRVTGPE